MLYAILGEDNKDSLPLRKELRPAHLKRLEPLTAQGRVILVGPHPAEDSNEPSESGFTGSLMVLEFASLQEAKSWADEDPYALGGVFKKVTVKPFIKVLP